MPSTLTSINTAGGLTVKAYRGDGACMLAFNLEDHLTDNLAGFAITRQGPEDTSPQPLWNRLSFSSTLTSATTAAKRRWFPSTEAPFQKFWWVDFFPSSAPGDYIYEVTAMRYNGGQLKPDQSVKVKVQGGFYKDGCFEIGFTRGFIQSQAYADKFKNAPFAPPNRGIDFDTTPYQDKYKWLGYHARELIFSFLDECVNDTSCTVDMLAYDLDEPDIIRSLAKLQHRLRILVDDSDGREKNGTSREDDAVDALEQAGAKTVRGHFARLSHDKIIIKRDNSDTPVKVLTGSTNFSVTGIYVNANHILVVDNPTVAGQYGKMFEAVFGSAAKTAEWLNFSLSKKEIEFEDPSIPHFFVSFAPHKKPTFSLDRLLKEIKAADSSVLFAVMEMGTNTKGKIIPALRSLASKADIFSYGVTDSPVADDAEPDASENPDVTVFSPGSKNGILVKSTFLDKNVPEPFRKELGLGLAHRIHHKFVVIDFNDSDPVVFCGSSNLAEGGEQANGDNLLAIYDRNIATVFAIEAIRLVDHYAFRAAMQKATKSNPLRLKGAKDKPWWTDYYKPDTMRQRERLLFVR
jgi:PLD-like domain